MTMASQEGSDLSETQSYESLPGALLTHSLINLSDNDTITTIYELDTLLTSLNQDLEEVNFTVEKKNEADYKSKTLQCVVANVSEGTTGDWNATKTKEVIQQISNSFHLNEPKTEANDSTDFHEAINCIRSELAEDDDSEGWDETEDNGFEPYECLFCAQIFEAIKEGMEHLMYEHNFDLYALKQKHNMDVYSYLKLINYIRIHKPTVQTIMEAENPLWSDDRFLKPVVTDQWLMFDFDDWEDNIKTKLEKIFLKEMDHPSSDSKKVHALIKTYSSQLDRQATMLKKAMEDMDKMRAVTKNLVESNDPLPKVSQRGDEIEDDGYFGSYAHFGIHHEMLNDKIRTEAYRDAIIKNSTCLANKTVLDLGCGTGILSMFCASANAKHVIAVDQSEIIFSAMDIIRENSLLGKIELIRGRIEDVNLPITKVDVIVSEWMGYFLLFEGMLNSLIYARENHLAAGGFLLPNRCTISLVGCSDLERHRDLIGFWGDVYGYKMSCMVKDVVRSASIEVVPMKKIITTPWQVLDLDLYTCASDSVNFESSFEFVSLRDGTLTAIAGYFDTIFSSFPNRVQFSTGPQTTPTHWKQTVFYLRYPIPLGEGQKLTGRIRCQRSVRDSRALTVVITINGRKQEYLVD